MDRREFLQALAALGAAIGIVPDTLATLPARQVSTVWRQLQAAPYLFYVNSWGTLSAEAEEQYPATRRELYGLDPLPEYRTALLRYLDQEQAVGMQAELLLEDAIAAGAVSRRCSLKRWIRGADADSYQQILDSLRAWVEENPDETDCEAANVSGRSGQGAALDFFRHQDETADLLDIALIEGDHPGSSYFAAELRTPIDGANAMAAEHGIPIRFARGDD
jgi:hypothetical protein